MESALTLPEPEDMPEDDDLNSVHSSSSNNSIDSDLFIASVNFLAESDKCLKTMIFAISTQNAQLKIVDQEPTIFYGTFPIVPYLNLMESFKGAAHAGEELNSGIKSLSRVICRMLKHNINISEQLSFFVFIIDYLFTVSVKAESVLNLTFEALTKLYNDKEFSVDLEPVVTLHRYSEKLFDYADEYYRNIYINRPEDQLAALDPHFNIAWMVIMHIKYILELNMSILFRMFSKVCVV
jgi:hypothetical protein